jgi:multisubunit Na+/H+ antiporter MnhB subunit
MTRAQKIWDFLFGVALIGGAPIVTFMVTAFALHFAAGSQIVTLVVLTSATIAFVIACIWRRKHRVLPSSFFAAEILVAIFTSVLFMLVFIAAGYAAYRAD